MQLKKRLVMIALALVAVLTSAAVAEDALELPFEMPIPEGWRTETIPFPLGFAPELDYEGLEELRFAPGMFDPESEAFWTYAFVWWVPESTSIEAERLGKDLVAYYRGLSAAVAGQEVDLSAATFEAEVRELESTDAGTRRFTGRVRTLDAFATKETIELGVRITAWSCAPDHRVVFFELSPQPVSHPLWGTLAGIRDGFACP